MASRRELLLGAAVALWTACTKSGDNGETSGDTADRGDGDSATLDAACTPAHVTHGSEADGWTRLALADHPELQDVFSGKALTVNGTAVNVAHVAEGCFVAMGVVCTHQGCTVGYAAERNQFTCPCHGALYGVDGVPIAGPAPRPLPTYETDFDGDAVWVRIL